MKLLALLPFLFVAMAAAKSSVHRGDDNEELLLACDTFITTLNTCDATSIAQKLTKDAVFIAASGNSDWIVGAADIESFFNEICGNGPFFMFYKNDDFVAIDANKKLASVSGKQFKVVKSPTADGEDKCYYELYTQVFTKKKKGSPWLVRSRHSSEENEVSCPDDIEFNAKKHRCEPDCKRGYTCQECQFGSACIPLGAMC